MKKISTVVVLISITWAITMSSIAQTVPATNGSIAQALSAPDQYTGNINLLSDLLKQLVGGEVVQFDVKSPTALANARYKGGDQKLDAMIAKNGAENVFFIDVNATLEPNFLAKMSEAIKSVSAAHLEIPQRLALGGLEGSGRCDELKGSFNENLAVLFQLSEVGFKRVSGGNAEISNFLIDPNGFVAADMAERASDVLIKQWEDQKFPKRLDILIVGDNEVVIQRDQYSTLQSDISARIALEPTDWVANSADAEESAWKFLVATSTCGFKSFSIVTRRSFVLALAMDQTVLAKAKKITVQIVK
jgi:hypothetical protein